MRAVVVLIAVLAMVVAAVSAVPVRHHAPHEQQVLLEQEKPVDPDTNRNTVQLAQDRGMVVSEHTVTTADNYVLTIHRLSNPKTKPNGKVAVLQHGLMDTSATWVINSAKSSFAYQLATAGFDVWLLNSRGSKYSKHRLLNRNTDKAFWNFDFDDMISYDIPNSLSYILAITKKSSVFWAAHSQGCAITIAAIQKYPEQVGSKITAFAALAPVTFLQHHTSPLMKMMVNLHFDTALKVISPSPFVPTSDLLHKALGAACLTAPHACDGVVTGLFGCTGPNLDEKRTGVYFAHWPDGTSARNIVHWIQNARSGDFADFTGKEYPLAGYHVPTMVFYGDKDMLANPNDVATLVAKLGASVISSQGNGFAHMDFVWAESAAIIVYPKVTTWFEQMANKP